jgi:DNA-binding XRE family transcriptional regulator
MQLGDIIKMTRQKAFLSQETFAKELNVAVSTINRWENGKSKPNLTAMKNLKTFCSEYDLPYEELEKEWFAFGKGESSNG